MLEMGFLQPHVQTQQWERAVSYELAHFEAEGEPCLSPVVTADEAWFIMLNQGQKAIHRMPPSSVFLEGKIQNFSFTEQGYDHCLLGVWISDFCRCDTKRGDCHLWCLHQDADRSQESFWTSSASQRKSSFMLTMQDHTHMFEDLKSCHKFWLVKYIHPSPDQAPSDFCLFGVWGMQSIERSMTYNNVIWKVRTWLYEQEKTWYQQGIPVLVPCCWKAVEVDGDFVEKSGMESNHHFIMCNCVIFMI